MMCCRGISGWGWGGRVGEGTSKGKVMVKDKGWDSEWEWDRVKDNQG